MVSILIPNYNKASYLSETLESVLAQNYSDWECIIVDDHSTDGSWEILEKYSGQDPRFKIFKRPIERKQGGNAARNFAFENSKGEYIQWLDSDDLIHKNKISEQVSDIQSLGDMSISVANWKWIESTADIEQENDSAKNVPNLESRLEQYPDEGLDLVLWLFKNKIFIPIHSYLFKADLLRKSGLWNEDLIQNQDGEFMVRVLLNCKKIYYLHSVYTYYRRPDSNHLSKQITFGSWDSWYDSYILCDEAVLKIKDNPEVRKVLVLNYEMLVLSTIFDFPEIAQKSWNRIKTLFPKFSLDFNKPKLFISFSLLGFANTLKVRNLLKRLNLVSD